MLFYAILWQRTNSLTKSKYYSQIYLNTARSPKFEIGQRSSQHVPINMIILRLKPTLILGKLKLCQNSRAFQKHN